MPSRPTSVCSSATLDAAREVAGRDRARGLAPSARAAAVRACTTHHARSASASSTPTATSSSTSRRWCSVSSTSRERDRDDERAVAPAANRSRDVDGARSRARGSAARRRVNVVPGDDGRRAAPAVAWPSDPVRSLTTCAVLGRGTCAVRPGREQRRRVDVAGRRSKSREEQLGRSATPTRAAGRRAATRKSAVSRYVTRAGDGETDRGERDEREQQPRAQRHGGQPSGGVRSV